MGPFPQAVQSSTKHYNRRVKETNDQKYWSNIAEFILRATRYETEHGSEIDVKRSQGKGWDHLGSILKLQKVLKESASCQPFRCLMMFDVFVLGWFVQDTMPHPAYTSDSEYIKWNIMQQNRTTSRWVQPCLQIVNAIHHLSHLL